MFQIFYTSLFLNIYVGKVPFFVIFCAKNGKGGSIIRHSRVVVYETFLRSWFETYWESFRNKLVVSCIFIHRNWYIFSRDYFAKMTRCRIMLWLWNIFSVIFLNFSYKIYKKYRHIYTNTGYTFTLKWCLDISKQFYKLRFGTFRVLCFAKLQRV